MQRLRHSPHLFTHHHTLSFLLFYAFFLLSLSPYLPFTYLILLLIYLRDPFSPPLGNLLDKLREQMDLCKSFANNKDECYAHITDEERDVLRNEGTHTPPHSHAHTQAHTHPTPRTHSSVSNEAVRCGKKSNRKKSAYTNYFSPHARSDRAVLTGTILRHSQYSPSSSPLPPYPPRSHFLLTLFSHPLLPRPLSLSSPLSLPSCTTPFSSKNRDLDERANGHPEQT
jgi:hypothetical protein